MLTHLQLVFVLFVYLRQQLGLAPVQGVDEGVALRHQASLKLHTVLLQEKINKKLEKQSIWRQKICRNLQLETKQQQQKKKMEDTFKAVRITLIAGVTVKYRNEKLIEFNDGMDSLLRYLLLRQEAWVKSSWFMHQQSNKLDNYASCCHFFTHLKFFLLLVTSSLLFYLTLTISHCVTTIHERF